MKKTINLQEITKENVSIINLNETLTLIFEELKLIFNKKFKIDEIETKEFNPR
jgi:hypothetical protein